MGHALKHLGEGAWTRTYFQDLIRIVRQGQIGYALADVGIAQKVLAKAFLGSSPGGLVKESALRRGLFLSASLSVGLPDSLPASLVASLSVGLSAVLPVVLSVAPGCSACLWVFFMPARPWVAERRRVEKPKSWRKGAVPCTTFWPD